MRSSPIRKTACILICIILFHSPAMFRTKAVLQTNDWFKIFVIRLLIKTVYSCNSQHDLRNFDQGDQTTYHDITDTSEILTADEYISDIDNAEDSGSTSSDDHNVMESRDDDLQGIVPPLASSTIAGNDVLVNSVNAELRN